MCIAVPVEKIDFFDETEGFGYKVMTEKNGFIQPLFPRGQKGFGRVPKFFKYAKNSFVPFKDKAAIRESLIYFGPKHMFDNYVQGFNFFLYFDEAAKYLRETGYYYLNAEVGIYKIYYQKGIGSYTIPSGLVGNYMKTSICSEFIIMRRERGFI